MTDEKVTKSKRMIRILVNYYEMTKVIFQYEDSNGTFRRVLGSCYKSRVTRSILERTISRNE